MQYKTWLCFGKTSEIVVNPDNISTISEVQNMDSPCIKIVMTNGTFLHLENTTMVQMREYLAKAGIQYPQAQFDLE